MGLTICFLSFEVINWLITYLHKSQIFTRTTCLFRVTVIVSTGTFAKSNAVAFASKLVYWGIFCPHFVPPLWLCLTHSVRSAWRVYTSACEGQLIFSLMSWMLRWAVQISCSGLKHLFPKSVGCWQFRAESVPRNCPWLKWLPLPRLQSLLRGSQDAIIRCFRVEGWSPYFNLGHSWGPLQFQSFLWSWLTSAAAAW